MRLKPGQVAPRGPLLVIYARFISTGTGFFSVDSYTRLGSQQNGGSGVDYGDIPIFTSQDGFNYKLADYLDFRPVRRDAINTFTANNYIFDVEETGAGPKISEPGNDIVTDYSYYLPRVDRVVLHKSRTFEIIQGIPGKNPITPAQPEEAMTLYILNYPPYLTYPSSTAIQRFRNRRYTMKDISVLEKRIENLEYYTSLSLAELATLNKQDLSIRDDTGIPRFKNGMLIDSFVDKSVADVIAPDFAAAIDIQTNSCRGSYNIAATRVFSNNSLSDSNVEYNGPLLMLDSSITSFIQQPKSSKTLNINPFNVVNFIGTIQMDPSSDVWNSENRIESQNIDLTGGQAARDAWSSIQSTTWGAWQTTWTGSEKVLSSSSESVVTNRRATGESARVATGDPNARGLVIRGDIVTTTTQRVQVTQTVTNSRTGILSQIVPQTLTKSLGDRVLDITVVQYMREKSILVLGTKFKPFTTLYSFFDNASVDKYLSRVNSFTFANNNLAYQTTISRAETVKFHEVSSNTVIGTGGIVLTSNNTGYIVTISPTASFGSWANATSGIKVIGNITGQSHILTSWKHYTGTVRDATSSTITLANNAGGATNTGDYVGQPVFIVRGKGAGQSATVSSYNSSTLVLTINGTWSTTPDTTSIYSIGRVETDENGSTVGIFNIPADIFRTGEKLFRFIDNSTNTVENSKTNGDTSFFSSGIIETKQQTSVSVFTPTVKRTSVRESFSSTNRTVKTVTNTEVDQNAIIGYYDPLAQTFLVNGSQYPQGVVIDSVRVCFRTKDTTVPVTLQIRPVVNGFPSSSVIYPYGEKTLTPDQVTITTIPDITDSTKYTEFKFDVPVLLLPGEHCFVLLSNSIGYEAFVAEIGATDLKTNVKISEQPYTGSLFLSQNGSTWTPDQLADLMFSIQKRTFSTNPGFAYFEVDMTTNAANVVYDIAHLMSTDAVVANTTLTYDFSSERVTGGQHTLINIIPNIDYDMKDGYGRRVLSTTTGNTTFQVRATLESTNPDVSPMIDTTRLNLLTIENKINYMPLQNSGFMINNQGTGYASGPSIIISGGGGTGANAYATVDGGLITGIVLDAQGTGYVTSPTITITSSTGGSGANVTYNGEDRATGGNAGIRYITKKVQLASGFDAGDLRVYLTMYKPYQSGILVYYKLLATDDPDLFETKNYQLMTQLGDPNFISADETDVRELTFAPGVYNTGVPDNKVSYTTSLGTYPSFSVFAIKIVLYGVSTVDVPIISDLRVVALPSTVV